MATTWHEIRDGYIANIKALTPNLITEKFNERPVKHTRLQPWALDNPGSVCLRKFEMFRDTIGVEAPLFDPAKYAVEDETFELIVAYPTEAHQLYGGGALDDLEKIMEEDANQLRDTITSAGNYQSEHNLSQFEGGSVERDDAVWFNVMTFLIRYHKLQTLT